MGASIKCTKGLDISYLCAYKFAHQRLCGAFFPCALGLAWAIVWGALGSIEA